MAKASRRWGSDSSTFCQVSLDWSSTRIASAGDACPGELAGELAALDDAVVPVDAAGCDY